MSSDSPLKILLGNNTLSLLAGSETYLLTLALQLKRIGHQVECFSPELGIIADKLERENIKCFKNIQSLGIGPFSVVLEEKPKYDYDIIIASHWHIVKYLKEQFPTTPIISIIHGIIHWMDNDFGKKIKAPEHPADPAIVDQFICPSEEVQELLKKEYNIEAIIIRNFFDIKEFETVKAITDFSKPKTFLVNSNYTDRNGADIGLIREVARHYDAKLIAIGQNFSLTDNIIQAINDADIVVGMGRSVLEGVCAGRLGIVHGRWGTGGIINAENIYQLRRFNFSGRNSKGKFFTKEELIKEIDKYYNAQTIQWGVQYMKTEHNVNYAADMFIRLARDLINKKTTENKVIILPYRRARDVKNS